MKILDVGCSDTPHGDINVDIKLHFQDRTSQPDILCDGLALPFTDNSFSLVRSQHTIEHITDPYDFVKELGRVSSKYLFIACPNPHAWRIVLLDQVAFNGTGHHYHGHSACELRLMFQQANFKIVQINYGWSHTRKKRKLDPLVQFLDRVLPWDIQRLNQPEIRVLGRKNQ